MASHLEEHDDSTDDHYPDDRRMQQYGNLFFLLQSEPRHIATLCRLVNLAEIDTLLQTVMFTLYGNQYESREEHLLLTMFQVRYTFKRGTCHRTNDCLSRMSWQHNSRRQPSLHHCYVPTHLFRV